MNSLELIGFLIVVRSLFCDCNIEPHKSGFDKNSREYKISRVGKIPKSLRESSGIIPVEEEDAYYIHNDSGGDNKLFKINREGELLDEVEIANSSNIDWEDIAQDDKGNIYIGDFGNNANKRNDLRIYKVDKNFQKTDTISFSYADQQEFPPPKKERNFDSEGFFWLDGELNIISKNWGKKCVKRYVVPDKKGNYELEPVEEFYLNGMITGADLSPDGSKMVLLSYGKLYLFDIKSNQPLFSQPYKCINFYRGGQAEAVAFINNEDLLITNELGKMFLMEKSKGK